MANTSLIESLPPATSAAVLAARIAAGEVSAQEVLESHIERIRSNETLNALAVPLFEQARADADRADRAYARGELLGPLHGVPFSVKEMFDVAGTATTAGLVSHAGLKATRDAESVCRLRQAGGILLGKANVGQLAVMYETTNPLYGRTSHPGSALHSPGGSSGGDAALVAVGGAALGLGSDHGGSIRQPAHVCGIHGLKPTSGRLPLRGYFGRRLITEDQVQPGPLARYVSDLELALRVLGEGKNPDCHSAEAFAPLLDPVLVPVDSLRIGVYQDDGIFTPSPAIRRIVREAAAVLEAQGAQVETFSPVDPWKGWGIYFRLFYADALRGLRKQIGGDRCDRRVRQALRLTLVPSAARPALGSVLEWFDQRFPSQLLRQVRKRSLTAGEYCELLAERDEYRAQFLRWLDASHLDILLCPPCGLPAIPHGSFPGPAAASYSFLFNLLGMPAGVVSLSRVRAGEETDRQPGWDICERAARVAELASTGMPIGVQVVGRHWREDVVLAVMKTLEMAFSHKPDYPAGKAVTP
jgi:fatty acid amide hydrolase